MTIPQTPLDAPRTDSTLARSVIWVLSIAVVGAVMVLIYVLPRQPHDGAPGALATANAVLNACAAVCLCGGLLAIKQKRIQRHKRWMLGAFGLSALFLVGYVLHHMSVGSVPFRGQGWVRTLYFGLLIPHILLAAPVLPMALFTIYRGWTNRIDLHRRIARVTLPIWLFVSVSGVLVYLMLYHL